MNGVLTVLVTVGTDHHGFNRLMDWVEAWISALPSGAVACAVQHGSSRPIAGAQNTELMPYGILQEAMDRADVVVTHGGPASLHEARRFGHLPVCVPRDAALHEIVDGHQQVFARHMAANGLVVLCEDQATFSRTMDQFVAHPPQRTDTRSSRPPEGMSRLAEVVRDAVDKGRRRVS